MMANEPPDDPEFESLLHPAWEKARRIWPQVDLSFEVFVRFVQDLPKDAKKSVPGAPIEQKELEELYLTCACVNDVPGAILSLEHDYMSKLPGLLGYLKLPAAVLEEICQEVRKHLLVRTPEGGMLLNMYTGRGSLLSWLKVTSVRMALRQAPPSRETPDEHALAALEELPALGTDPEMALLKQRFRAEFRQALREAFASLSSQQRHLLRLHFIQRLPTTKMAPLFGKDQSTISRWLKDAREKVYEETKRLLKERLQLSSREFESTMNAFTSVFDIGLSQILGEENEGESEEGDAD